MASPNLSSSPEELFEYAMEGDRSNLDRSNFREALAVLQFQLLLEQQKAAKASVIAAVGALLLFAATVALVVATAM